MKCPNCKSENMDSVKLCETCSFPFLAAKEGKREFIYKQKLNWSTKADHFEDMINWSGLILYVAR